MEDHVPAKVERCTCGKLSARRSGEQRSPRLVEAFHGGLPIHRAWFLVHGASVEGERNASSSELPCHTAKSRYSRHYGGARGARAQAVRPGFAFFGITAKFLGGSRSFITFYAVLMKSTLKLPLIKYVVYA